MNLVKSFQLNNPYKGNWIFWLLSTVIALLELLSVVGFISVSINPYVLPSLFILSVLLSFFSPQTKISYLYLLFFAYLALNIYITDPPFFFFPWLRLALFVILLLAVSPAIENNYLRYIRFNIFKIFFYIAIPLSVISFFGYFVGINFFNQEMAEEYGYTRGLFGGLFNHSMMLGPIAALSSLITLWFALKKNKLAWILVVCCLGAVLFSASRAALFGVIGGAGMMFLTFSKNIMKGIRVGLLIILVGAFTYPIWNFAMEGIQSKNNRYEAEEIFDTRQEKFDIRKQEISENPIFGIGFSSIDITLGDYYNLETGTIEPGTSWLAVISMTGIIGLIFFLIIYYKSYQTILTTSNIYSSLFSAFLTFFAIHLIVEGYVYAARSPLCFIFWISIGLSRDLKYLKS